MLCRSGQQYAIGNGVCHCRPVAEALKSMGVAACGELLVWAAGGDAARCGPAAARSSANSRMEIKPGEGPSAGVSAPLQQRMLSGLNRSLEKTYSDSYWFILPTRFITVILNFDYSTVGANAVPSQVFDLR